MTTRVYIVRHGEAEGNLYRRAQGHTDGNLTETGLRQLKALKERFRGIHLDVAYSSDLTRAYMTGRAVCDPLNIEVTPCREFREICLGIWEDMPWGEIVRDYKEAYKLFDRRPYEWHVEGCEAYADAGKRFLNAMTEKVRENEGKTIAIFSHGTVIRSAIMEIYDRYPEVRETDVGHCDNTAITLLNVGGDGISVEYMYDSEHLGELSTFNRHYDLLESRNYKVNAFFRLMDPKKDMELYCAFRLDDWRREHGEDYDTGPDAAGAKQALTQKADCIAFAVLEGEEIGVIELDTERGAGEKKGHIAFYYLQPQYRGMSLGVQLLSYAVKYYREYGRERLTLAVFAANEKAVGFYEYYGFQRAGYESSPAGRLLLMEKDIRRNTVAELQGVQIDGV